MASYTDYLYAFKRALDPIRKDKRLDPNAPGASRENAIGLEPLIVVAEPERPKGIGFLNDAGAERPVFGSRTLGNQVDDYVRQREYTPAPEPVEREPGRMGVVGRTLGRGLAESGHATVAGAAALGRAFDKIPGSEYFGPTAGLVSASRLPENSPEALADEREGIRYQYGDPRTGFETAGMVGSRLTGDLAQFALPGSIAGKAGIAGAAGGGLRGAATRTAIGTAVNAPLTAAQAAERETSSTAFLADATGSPFLQRVASSVPGRIAGDVALDLGASGVLEAGISGVRGARQTAQLLREGAGKAGTMGSFPAGSSVPDRFEVPQPNVRNVRPGTTTFARGEPTFDAVARTRPPETPLPPTSVRTVRGAQDVGAAPTVASRLAAPVQNEIGGVGDIGSLSANGGVGTPRSKAYEDVRLGRKPDASLFRRIRDPEAASVAEEAYLDAYSDALEEFERGGRVHPFNGGPPVQDAGGAGLGIMTSMAGAGTGAAVGYAADDENRLRGAIKGGLIGAGAGAVLPRALRTAMGTNGLREWAPLTRGPNPQLASASGKDWTAASARADGEGTIPRMATPAPNPTGQPKASPLPLPPMHPDLVPAAVEPAWQRFSARYPRLAAEVRAIDALPPGSDAAAMYDPRTGTISVPVDAAYVQDGALFHEGAHLAQDLRRQETRSFDDALQAERYAQRLSRAFDTVAENGVGATAARSAIGAGAGATYGAATGDDPEERKFRAIQFGAAGMVGGALAPGAINTTVRALGNNIGAVGDDITRAAMRQGDVPLSWWGGIPEEFRGNARLQRAYIRGMESADEVGPEVNFYPEGSAELEAQRRGWADHQPKQPVRRARTPQPEALQPRFTVQPASAGKYHVIDTQTGRVAEELGGIGAERTARSVAQQLERRHLTAPESVGVLAGTRVVDDAGEPLRVFHGTSKSFEEFDPAQLDADAMYGPGMYFTENPAVAEGYSKVGQQSVWSADEIRTRMAEREQNLADPTISDTAREKLLGYQRADRDYLTTLESPGSNIRPARLAVRNPFEIDRTYSEDEVRQLWEAAGAGRTETFENATAGFRRGSALRRMTGEEVYEWLSRRVLSGDKQAANETLRSLGYDGITHIGGGNTGTDPHRVWIAFDRGQVRSAFGPAGDAAQTGASNLRPLTALAGAGTGAAVGGAVDDEDPLRGAVAGGLAGFGAGALAPEALRSMARQAGNEVGAVGDIGGRLPPLPERTADQFISALRESGDGATAANLERFMDGSQVRRVVFHGTLKDFEEFRPDLPRSARQGHAWDRLGLWFTDDPRIASNYADGSWRGETGGNVVPVYLSLRNPLKISYNDILGFDARRIASLRRRAQAAGHDGVALRRFDGEDFDYVAFDPGQIKSATGNRGQYNPADWNITGAADNAALRGIAGAGAGGAVGYATGDDEGRAGRALAGAVAGAGVGLAPEALRSMRRLSAGQLGAVPGDPEQALYDALRGEEVPTADIIALASGEMNPRDFARKHGVTQHLANEYQKHALSLTDEPGYLSPLDDEMYTYTRPRPDGEMYAPLERDATMGEGSDDSFLPPDPKYGSGGGQLGLSALSPEGVTTVRRSIMLANPAGRVRDYVSNGLFAAAETASDLPATVVDALIDRLPGMRGQRTKSFNLRATASAAWKGATEGNRDLVRAIAGKERLSRAGAAAEEAASAAVEGADRVVMSNPALDAFVRVTGRIAGSVDAPAAVYAYEKSIAEQARVMVLNERLAGGARLSRAEAQARIAELTANPTDEMKALAVSALAHATFTNESVGSRLVSGLRDATIADADKGRVDMPWVRAGLDFITPFRRVPGAVAGKTLEYSPLGAVKVARDAVRLYRMAAGGNADAAEISALRRGLSQTAGRVVTGATVIWIGAELADQGLMTGTHVPPELKNDGAPPMSIHIQGRWWPLSQMAPVGPMLAVGAELHHEGVAESGLTLGQSVTDATLMRGMGDARAAVTRPDKAESFVESAASSFVPPIVGQVARIADPVRRDPDGPLEAIEARIPGLSQNVESRRGPLGEEYRETASLPGRVAFSLLDATRSSPDRRGDDPLVDRFTELGFRMPGTTRRSEETREAFLRRIAGQPEAPQRAGETPAQYALRSVRWRQPRPAETEEEFATRQRQIRTVANRYLREIVLDKQPQRQIPDDQGRMADNPMWGLWSQYHGMDKAIRDAARDNPQGFRGLDLNELIAHQRRQFLAGIVEEVKDRWQEEHPY